MRWLISSFFFVIEKKLIAEDLVSQKVYTDIEGIHFGLTCEILKSELALSS
jgi:hypothetical protein